MTAAAAAVALGLVWSVISGELHLSHVAIGIGIGSAVLLVLAGPRAAGRLARRLRMAGELAMVFAWELVVANLRVAWDVLTPRHRMHPGVIAVPLTATSDIEILVLANMVSLTPGTLSLDVSDDRRVLYVHAMYLHDRDALTRSIKDGFERRLLEVGR